MSRLWERFVTPPDEARPRVWWHWMDGNVDPVGIDRDLQWLHAVGIRGVHMFDGAMGMPPVVPRPVRPGTPEWQAAMQAAARRTAGLGMEFAVATSSGWSASGAPWVTPADAMKKVVWSECLVEAGAVDVLLPALPAVEGPYQDMARWGLDAPRTWSTDWITLAVPDDPSLAPLTASRTTASHSVRGLDGLTGGSHQSPVRLPRDPDAWSSAWVEHAFPAPTTVRSVTVGLPGPRGFGSAPAPRAVLQASDDGVTYRDIVDLPETTVPVRSASFPPVTATRFRLVLSGESAAAALPPLSGGVRRPPVIRPAHAFALSEFSLRSVGLVHASEVKAGFGVVPDYYAIDTDPDAVSHVIDVGRVRDVTDHVHQGRLTWVAPEGRWRILRFGASLTGQTNGPARTESTGLEIDKLDGARVRAYLARHLEEFTGDSSGVGVTALLSDSIEAGAQNWTDQLAAAFERLRGYPLACWLPTIAGYVVGGAAKSDAFLYDYRRTIADLLSGEYYGTLAAEAASRGLTYYAEALEDGRPQLGDDLAMRAPAHVPMGAMWTHSTDAGPRPTYVADLKGAASVAHVYGKPWVGSEAFTSFDRPWESTPGTLKHVADLQLTLGVTRFCIHTSPHQPESVPPPGIALAPFLGQVFTRHEVWAQMAAPWIDYLARCSAVLSAGEPAVDFAVFVGEEAPVTALPAPPEHVKPPPGFDIDYVTIDALETVLQVSEGRLRSAGAGYAALILGGTSHRMTLRALRALERLLDAGATVIGTPPATSPSLMDDAAEFAAVCANIWSSDRSVGRVFTCVSDAVSALSLSPRIAIDDDRVRSVSRLVDGELVCFLSNPTTQAIALRIEAPDRTQWRLWDPVAVRDRPLPRNADGSVTVTLAPSGSVFLVPLRRAASVPTAGTREMLLGGDWMLELPGELPARMTPHPQPWTSPGIGAVRFSGTGVYRHEFTLTSRPARAILRLGDLHGVARVILNGTECGVAWAAPLEIDVSASVREGANTVEVIVANVWRNRLIAEAGAPTGEVFTPMTEVFEPDAAPAPSGLAGPISLLLHP